MKKNYFYLCKDSIPFIEIASLDKKIVLIGKSKECDVIIKEGGVSRRHCRIQFNENDNIIEDMNSSLGTYINGTEVTSPQSFSYNEIIKVGSVEIKVSSCPLSIHNKNNSSTLILSTYMEQFKELPDNFRIALEKVIEEITTLYDISKQINSETESSSIFESIIDKVSTFFGVKRGFLMLSDEKDQFKPVVIREVEDYFKNKEYGISSTILSKVLKTGEAFITMNAGNDSSIDISKSIVQFNINSVICVPLKVESKILGVIYLETRGEQRAFNKKDLYFLQTIAEHIAIILKKEKLYIELADKKILEEQIKLANKIQSSIMPVEFPEIDGIFIDSFFEFAKQTGGDFFDVKMIDEDKIAFLMADVSGKGIPSALLATMGKGVFRSILNYSESPAEIFTTANKILYEEIQGLFKKMFITAFMGIYSISDKRLVYTSAGHEPGYVISENGGIIQLDATGVPLGIMPDSLFEEKTVDIKDGDTIFTYTDGITELTDHEENMFEDERLQKLLSECVSPQVLKNYILDNINEFRGNSPLNDDLSFLIICNSNKTSYIDEMKADLKYQDDFIEKAENFLKSLHLIPSIIDELVISLYETITNAVKYGKKELTILLKIRVYNSKIKVMVRNPKEELEIEGLKNLKELIENKKTGKRGLPLVFNLNDGFYFEYDEDYTYCYFWKNIKETSYYGNFNQKSES